LVPGNTSLFAPYPPGVLKSADAEAPYFTYLLFGVVLGYYQTCLSGTLPLEPHLLPKIQLFLAGCWWFICIILATQEAEIRRVKVQSQSGQVIHKTLSQKKKTKTTHHKKGVVEA
jgi:hypothetical protein